ncbi:kinesin-like protein KIF20A [Panonychus citri]|uniref:kinesin-like protein KIF20A n=1 Tax=Panonychus citri TaxID=50023 RepID=UPI0023074565|nr:kinesin-like protein KIF20A [Panonychus citri]
MDPVTSPISHFYNSFPLVVESPNSVNCVSNNLNGKSLLTSDDEKIATFLRIRPIDNFTIEESPYKIIDSNKIYIDEKTSSNCGSAEKINATRNVYNFTEILDESVNQLNVFSKCCLPLVEDVLDGNNGILFCYGTTSSGKSFTMRGPHEDPTVNPGLIPLSLKKIFSSRKFMVECNIAKAKFDDVILTDQKTQELSKLLKDSILSSPFCRNVSASSTVEKKDNFKDDQPLYICYLSYFEIYNDLIYDLLDSSSSGREYPLSLLPDDTQRYYVKDLKSILVSSLSEALKVYKFGWKNLQRNIKLNKGYNQSHSFLHITLVKFGLKLLDPQVSHFVLGELFGCEQEDSQPKGHCGPNINIPLMKLSECINQAKLRQKNLNRNHVIPFRNSNLTKFFQPYLTGTGRVVMIININPSPDLFGETLRSLRFGTTQFYSHSMDTFKPTESKQKMIVVTTKSSNEIITDENTNLIQTKREALIRAEVISEFKQFLDHQSMEHEKECKILRSKYEELLETRLTLCKEKHQVKINNMQMRIDNLINLRDTIIQPERIFNNNDCPTIVEKPKVTNSDETFPIKSNQILTTDKIKSKDDKSKKKRRRFNGNKIKKSSNDLLTSTNENKKTKKVLKQSKTKKN